MPVPVSGIGAREFVLHGLDPVLRLLEKLPRDLEKKAWRTATRAGANVLKKQAASNFKDLDDPATKERKVFRNVAVQFAPRMSKAKRAIAMRTGVLGGAAQYSNTKENVRKHRVGKTYLTGGDWGNPGGDTWYWRFLEFGVPSRGIAAKQPMQNALRSKASEVGSTFARIAEREVFRTIDRLKARK